ncbi:MAG: HDOD domain-containing protein [Pelosinus sp.]|nr:HDOD domain-containing protein [Pelosinus sp.]
MSPNNKFVGKKVLFVDDEQQILRSIERLFFDSDYEIFTVDSGEAALGMLAEEQIDLIVSDMRMPIMDGYKLLCRVKELYPKVLRVILSGYADEKVVMQAIQKNIAKMYMYKPWENQELIGMLEKIFETEEMLSDGNLKELVNNIEELPILKNNYQAIIDLVEREAEFGPIASAIERDQSIAIKVLHVANSAFFGVKTGSVKQAITYLGLSNIRNLLISVSIVDTLKVPGVSEKEISYLWQHAFLSNKILHEISKKLLNKPISESEFSAGLLHNIGNVFFLKYFPKEYLGMYNMLDVSQEGVLELEQRYFPVTHQQAGGYLLKWWDLPYPIVEAALYHHTPFDSHIINKELVLAVNIAQHYASKILNQSHAEVFDDDVFSALGQTQEKVEEVVNGIEF